MQLSLDCLTLTNTRPVDLIRGAGAAGFDLVSLWMQPPSLYPLQLVTPAMEKECAEALAQTGVRVHALEVFDLFSIDTVQSYVPALELGARLGATTAVAINMRNPDAACVSDAFGLFAELAGQFSLGVNIEPVAICQTSTLVQARDIIRSVNNRRVATLQALREAAAGLKPGMPVTLQIQRDGTLMYVSFTFN